ncbi:NAD(P)-binding domain-containing protein [Paenibacillus montanisoli]|uniref:Mannitol dehydrogenase C-terminal domain-containing protein n=1 Tax=Paenibacillus montanisoli TaxID=2081970 RepID=A0A328U8V1_9BACL|nr:NAD(P)-binding domain-containing protein [Paenibacillus montanisoli]RAP76584.1 hypothetical protein DL346_14555 [Paenibacillus montanisoli]
MGLGSSEGIASVQDSVFPTAVIIGAGKTGRGFIARLAASAGYRIVFADRSQELIERLTEERGYTIHYFDSGRSPVQIQGVTAFQLHSEEALLEIAAADTVFTAVGEQNLASIGAALTKAARLRQSLLPGKPLRILTCENGVAPGLVLRKALSKAMETMEAPAEPVPCIVSEAAVFCSTIERENTKLDIMSEAYEELPYDAETMEGSIGITAMIPVYDFRKLLQRKIYTYNCISACIAYLGAFKSMESYAGAANDPDIRAVIERILGPLNRAIACRLDVELSEQERFAERAIRKFSDRSIQDSIERNARDVIRKLGSNERLVAPALWIMDNADDIDGLALVIAAALYYYDPINGLNAFMLASGLDKDHMLTRKSKRFLELLLNADNRAAGLFAGLINTAK